MSIRAPARTFRRLYNIPSDIPLPFIKLFECKLHTNPIPYFDFDPDPNTNRNHNYIISKHFMFK